MKLFPYNTMLVWFIPLIMWTLFWKGYALWTTVNKNDKKWFIVLLIFNTVGILEIIYIFHIAKKKWTDINSILNKNLSNYFK